ncbi:MAG TPA: hypothetical protein VKW06_12310 [Candidatus Angelobacter sp.]|nr:hypothetical protein [Candidatus Angelobacter sp.]
MNKFVRSAGLGCSALALALACGVSAAAADLKEKTTEAFDKYVAATEQRLAEEVKPGGRFLYPDGPVPFHSEEMRDAYNRLKRGEILIARQESKLNGKDVDVPDGMVHHWVGIVFIPGVNLAQVLDVAKDYDHRAELYKPDVIAAHTIWHQDDNYRIFMRLYQRRFTTVMFNTDYAIHWATLDANRVYCDSISTRVTEVKDPSHPDGPEEQVGQGHGYLWRLNTYWRFEEKDGGVYVQLEALSLTRDIPYGLGWLIKPLVTKIPKQSLDRALGRTREAVLERSHAK